MSPEAPGGQSAGLMDSKCRLMHRGDPLCWGGAGGWGPGQPQRLMGSLRGLPCPSAGLRVSFLFSTATQAPACSCLRLC